MYLHLKSGSMFSKRGHWCQSGDDLFSWKLKNLQGVGVGITSKMLLYRSATGFFGWCKNDLWAFSCQIYFRLFSLSSVVNLAQQFIKKLNVLPGTHSKLLVAPSKTCLPSWAVSTWTIVISVFVASTWTTYTESPFRVYLMSLFTYWTNYYLI